MPRLRAGLFRGPPFPKPLFFVRSWNCLFFVPSPTFRDPERAERVKGGSEPRAARLVMMGAALLAAMVLSDRYGA